MPRGQHVEIHSLKGRPELNGKAGRIMGYDEAKGRYAVRVQAESILLKGYNLRRVAAQVEEVEESWESHDARLAEEQHAAFEQAQVQMSSGTPSSYRDAVKLALKCAGLAARREGPLDARRGPGRRQAVRARDARLVVRRPERADGVGVALLAQPQAHAVVALDAQRCRERCRRGGPPGGRLPGLAWPQQRDERGDDAASHRARAN